MPARTIVGYVVADRNDKTITVSATQRRRHPLYDKAYSVTRRYQAHDEDNQASIGDRVRIAEIRPVSRRKNWRLAKVIEKAGANQS